MNVFYKPRAIKLVWIAEARKRLPKVNVFDKLSAIKQVWIA